MDRRPGIPPRSSHYTPGGLSSPSTGQDTSPTGSDSDSEMASVSYGMRRVSISPSSPGVLQAANEAGAVGGAHRQEYQFSSSELEFLDRVRPLSEFIPNRGSIQRSLEDRRNEFWSYVDSTPMTLVELRDYKSRIPDGSSKGHKKALNNRIKAMESQPEGGRELLTPSQQYGRSQYSPEERSGGGDHQDYYAQPENWGYGQSNPVASEEQIRQGRSRYEVVNEQKQKAQQAYLQSKKAEEAEQSGHEDPVQQRHFCRTCEPNNRPTKESFEKKLFMRLPCTHHFYCENHMGKVNEPCDFVSENQLGCYSKIEELLQIHR